MNLRTQIALGLVLILFGGMIYITFRPTTLLLFHTLEAAGLMPLVQLWRQWAAAWQPSEFLVYSLPGALWSASWIFLTHGLLCRQPARLRIAVASIIPLMGIISELLQYWQLLPGAFDLADLVCYALPLAFLYMYVIIKNYRIWEIGPTASVASN